MLITALRKNIGVIIAGFGFLLLCILTFGNLGELVTDAYWQSVKENFTSIGIMSVSLTMIQTSIRQGFAEQALQRGLNTPRTQEKYEEHRNLIKSATSRLIYLPYFLQIYNKRHTNLRRQEFLVTNNYTSKEVLYSTGNKRLIKKYESLRVHITVGSIKWATTDIVYNKQGQITTLQEYRTKRTFSAVISSLAFMLGATFVTRGLFFVPSGEPLWQKFVKLFSYVITIAITSLLAMCKEYEKGALGVPNDLDEVNEIWSEFLTWDIPAWVIEKIAQANKLDEEKEDTVDEQGEERETGIDERTDIQEEQNEE